VGGQHYGVSAHGITLSEEQLEYSQQWIAEMGWQDRVTVELQDHRELPKTVMFDKVVSLGMVEHVGTQNYPAYFAQALSVLKPGGLFLSHGITSGDRWCGISIGEQFINRYIFPLRITYEIKPGIFDEKRGNAALLIKNSGFYFIFDPKYRLKL